MKLESSLKIIGTGSVLTFIVLTGTLITASRGQAGEHDRNSDEWRVRRGFAMAPVPLNLARKDPSLVGLGSYLVNAVAGCNGCHTNQLPNGTPAEFALGGNPFFHQPKKVNTAAYLGGGRDFGPVGPNLPHLFSRNLTPDKTGKPEGGHSFSDFVSIMRTGLDFDHLHPNCSASAATNCLPPPFDGDLLQVMPWPDFQDLSDHDLRAIYEYLRAVPCVTGPPDPTNPLHNECN